MRIKARAIRRCGELLQQFDARGGDRTKSGSAPTFAHQTQRQAAASAGLSKDQQVTAVRVANVPAPVFERAVDGLKPPTVSTLAEMGRVTRAPVERKAFERATHVLGEFGRLGNYIGVSALKPFINSDLILGELLEFSIPGTQFKGMGLTTEQFEMICRGYVQALYEGAPLTEKQRETAIKCAVLTAGAGMTRGQVAAAMGTTQSAVARMEGGRATPSFSSVSRYAEATGTRLHIELA